MHTFQNLTLFAMIRFGVTFENAKKIVENHSDSLQTLAERFPLQLR